VPAESSVSLDGRSTRLLRDGNGPPVVWLHDSPGNVWTPAHSQLSHHSTVIAPSLPGFDDSTTLNGIDGPEDVVFWLTDLFAELQLQRAVMLGCGLGGWMAAEYAVRYPARVSKLILVDAYGLFVPGALPADEFALTATMLRPLVYANAGTPDLQSAENVEATLHARVAAARLAWQFPYDRKLRARLRRAIMPALIVWGERDGLVPLAHGHAYADALPNATLRVLPGVAHYPYVEDPSAFTAEVQRFLAKA
jgi:pimeloyl-ACP methyl ester carboxylesterase